MLLARLQAKIQSLTNGFNGVANYSNGENSPLLWPCCNAKGLQCRCDADATEL